MMDYSSSPSGVGYYQGSPTGLGMSPSMGGMMGIVGKQSHSQQLSIHHQQQLQHNHPTRIYIPPPPSNTSSNSNSNSSHASHQYRQSPRTNASAVDVYAPNGPGPPSTIGPSILGGKGKSPVMRGEWDDPTYTNRVSSHPREESQIMGSVAEYDETEEERKGSELGISLGDFDMLDTLGTGTFGKVLLSRLRPSPSRPAQTQPHYFAMKVLEKVTVVRLRQVEHLNSERKTLARVRHPFIVNLFCTFHDERNLYLLLEYVQGGELFSHLRRAGRFSADVARFYAANLVLALEYLHERDIIYRDLKPENLLIDASGYLKITDFGFAKHVTDRTYTLCGTPEYLAPEIITATGHGKAADFWALGVLLFELLAGYPPFFADSPLEIYEKILAGKFSFPPHIDFVAKDLIKRLLTADLTKRLGNLKDGAEGVKRHRWFEGVAWEAVERKEIRAPIIPHTSTPGDTSNFEHYPACPLETLPGVVRAHHARQMGVPASELESGPDPYGYLFPAF